MNPGSVPPDVQKGATATPAAPIPWLAGLLAGLVATVVAQFFIDSLADGSDVWHWVQHGLLFAGGLLVGISLLQIYRAATR